MSNTNNETTVTTTTSQTIAVQAPVKRGRGRPKGSKNKPKFNVDGTPFVKVAKAV